MRTMQRAILAGLAVAAIGVMPAAADGGISVAAATRAGAFSAPLDAIPDPTGTTIYFTATGDAGRGVFRVPFAGGAASVVRTGEPFVAPVGIQLSFDGSRIYVADEAVPTSGRPGGIFVLPAAGGAASLLPGSQGTAARGMDLFSEQGVDYLYFSGRDPRDGQPAVLKLPAAGGDLTVVAKGAPLADPDGVAVATNGLIYVTDRAGGAVYRVTNLSALPAIDGVGVAGIAPITRLVGGATLGTPAGIAFTPDDSTLMVSSLSPSGTAQVLLIDLATGKTSTFDDVIRANNAAGGLHRAPATRAYAWADVSRLGRVFNVFFAWADVSRSGRVYAIGMG